MDNNISKNNLMDSLRMNQLQNQRVGSNRTSGSGDSKRKGSVKNGNIKNDAFENMLGKKLDRTSGAKKYLVFSKHASDRLKQRKIVLEESDIRSLEGAFDTAVDKGIKNPLIVSDKAICIGSTESRTIVTVMEDMKNRVFTNIDGVINV